VQSSSQNVTTDKPTPIFLQAGCPSCSRDNSVKALKGNALQCMIIPYLMMQMSPTTRSLLGSCLMSPLRTTRLCSCLSICCCSPRNCSSLAQLMNAVTSTISATANMMATLSISPEVRSVGSAGHEHVQHHHVKTASNFIVVVRALTLF